MTCVEEVVRVLCRRGMYRKDDRKWMLICLLNFNMMMVGGKDLCKTNDKIYTHSLIANPDILNIFFDV